MVQRTDLKSIIGLAFVGALAGCTGTSTYGTGVTQEAQLLEDVSSLAMLGSKKEKKRINYTSRPKLVKPPKVAALPSPAERVESESGYFPVNPERKRQVTLARIAEAERNGEAIPEEVALARRQSAERGKRAPQKLSSADDRYTGHADPKEEKAARAAFLKRRAERRGVSGAAPRKYLTEPPQVYRTPEQTAAVGVVGEKERDPYAKKKKDSLFGSLFGRKKKTKSAPAKTTTATN